jgi:hypothetical protein
MVHSIEGVHDLYLTHRGLLGGYNPVLLDIRGNKMYLHDFEVIFVGAGKFKLVDKTYLIEMSYNEILKKANDIDYASDPYFSYD